MTARPEPAPGPRTTSPAPPAAAPRILVVDDEPEVRAAVADGLAVEGYAVRGAADGLTALSEIAAWQPDRVRPPGAAAPAPRAGAAAGDDPGAGLGPGLRPGLQLPGRLRRLSAPQAGGRRRAPARPHRARHRLPPGPAGGGVTGRRRL